MCCSELLTSANEKKLLLNGEIFATRHNYFSRALIMKNRGSLEPHSLGMLALCNANNIISRLMLLCQSIPNMCNLKPAIYLSFTPNPKEKLKASTKLIQVYHRRNKWHMHFFNYRKAFSEWFKLTYEEAMKTSHGKCCTHSEKTYLHYFKHKLFEIFIIVNHKVCDVFS